MLGGLFGKQFVNVIDSTDEPGLLAFRFPTTDRQIQTGAQLTVREGQAAIFLDEGQVADIFTVPGLYTLDTSNLPIITALQHWDKGFNSPFKSDVYFISLREQVDRKWGTAQPLTIRDKDFGPIRLRTHGRFSFVVSDVTRFWRILVGNLDQFTLDDIEPQLRAMIVPTLASQLGSEKTAFLEMAGNQETLSAAIKETLAPEFERFGLALSEFQVESLSLPDEVQARIELRSNRIGTPLPL